MEVDNEVSGNGNSYTTEFRQYDPRLGRWKSLDPLMTEFPHMSPYCAFDNNPVYYNDPYGLCTDCPDGEPEKTQDLEEVVVTAARKPTEKSKAEDISRSLITKAGSAREFFKDPRQYLQGHESQLFNYDPQNGNYDLSNPRSLGESVWTNLENQAYIENHSDGYDYPNFLMELSASSENVTEKEVVYNLRAKSADEIQGEMMMVVGEAIQQVLGLYLSGNLFKNARSTGTLRQQGIKFGTRNPMALRQAYVQEVRALKRYGESMLEDGLSKESVAKTLHGMRRNLGKRYKSLTPRSKRSEIFSRNMKKYGDKYGPTVKYLREQGKSWDDIIKSSSRAGGKDLGY